jgi:hypothetical protein
MRRFHPGLILLGLLGLACAGTSATPLPDPARDEGAVFYVENHGKDERQLEQVIAGALQARGLDATGGAKGQGPENVDFLVSYEDRWAWDMRTYLRLIQIDVRDAKSGEIVATSRSYQDSLTAMGKTYQQIIERTTHQLLDGAP